MPLPYFPTKTLSQEELDILSDELIKCYTGLRFTNPQPRNSAVKNARVKLPPLQVEGNNSLDAHDQLALSEELEKGEISQIPKCFLHPKPRASCERCQMHITWKRASKRHKLE